VAWCLAPETVDNLLLAKGKEEQRHGCRIAIMISHEAVASNNLELGSDRVLVVQPENHTQPLGVLPHHLAVGARRGCSL
jgi:hypothetical protein